MSRTLPNPRPDEPHLPLHAPSPIGQLAALATNRVSVLIMFAIMLVTLAVMTLSFIRNVHHLEDRAEAELKDKARLVTAQFLSIRRFMAESQGERPGGNYEHLDPRAAEQGVNQVLGYAWEINEVWTKGGGPGNRPDAFECRMLEQFGTDPTRKEFWGTEDAEGKRVFRYGIPIRMQSSCLNCHGKETSHRGTTPLAQEFELGDLAGAVSIVIPMKTFQENLRTDTVSQMIFTFSLLLLSVGITYFLMTRWVTVPLKELTEIATHLGEGDLYAADRDIRAYGEIRLLAQEFRTMASRLKDFYQRLEEKVTARTRELTEQKEELKRVNAELAKSNKLKSVFLTNMSHELRTPLTAVLAFGELLQEGIGGELTLRQGEYTQGILESSRQLLSLINDLLDLAKIEAGKMELKLSTFDVEEMVQGVAKQMAPLELKKGLSLEVDLPEMLPAVLADREKIGQVLVNLVSNAIKFTPSGGSVRITGAFNLSENAVVLTVADTGIGIRKEDQEVIFDAFRQVDGSTTREYRGTGLGLSLVRHLVQMHRGRIWVESELGKGSRFSFSIPLNFYVKSRNGQVAPSVDR